MSFAAACNEDILSGPGFVCDATNPVVDLFLDPSTAVVFVHSPARTTDIATVTARATNRNGAFRTDVPITFASSDTSIAMVDSLGVIHALKPGAVRITASTCGKTATAQVTVTLLPVTVQIKLDTAAVIAGDSVLVRARARTPDSVTVAGAKFTFTSSPSTGITIAQRSDSTAMIRTSSSGTFTIIASGEGSAASATLVVAPRVFVGAAAANGAGLDIGRDFGCGLIPLGRLYCWGVNGSNQLGARTDSLCFEEMKPAGSTNPCSLSPVRVGEGLVFSSISAGDGFACGIATLGAAYCWGDGSFGKAGNGSNGGASAPKLVTSGLSFASVSAGGHHACGLAGGGAAYCWGMDSTGQLGDARHVNSTTPIPVSGGSTVATFASITAGFRHTCGLQTDGVAFCWGRDSTGELGNGGFSDADTPVPVAGGLRFTSISAGGDTIFQLPPLLPRVESHTCAIAIGGAAYCWGSNRSGQLGTGSIGDSSAVPVAVTAGLTFASISAGARHTCGLTTGGAVYCWGHNQDLQLGRGPPTGGSGDSGVAQVVVGGDLSASVALTTISAGTRHSCAVGSDGAAYCWGSNVFGALGNTLQAAFRGFPQRVATPK